MQVNAVDMDTGNNARLTYRIANPANETLVQQKSSKNQKNKSAPNQMDVYDLFGIFPNSGWIYLRGTLDRETFDRYELTILASDNGTPSATATARVIVNIMDANDNDPKFMQSSYEFTIEENLRRGAIVGVIHAVDNDFDINAEIRYSLIPSNNSFQINEITGEFFKHDFHF